MNKWILILLCASTLKLSAQEVVPTENSKFRFGLFFSPNLAWEKPENDGFSSSGSSLGYGFGLHAERRFTRRYAFCTGLNINKISYGHRTSSFGIPTALYVRTQYVEIPLVLRLSTNEIGYMTYFGKFGLAPSFSIGSKYSTLADATWRKFDSQSQSLRMALIIGFGTEYNISGDTRLFAGVDFNNGFTNVYTKKLTDANNERIKAINNFISLQLGVIF